MSEELAQLRGRFQLLRKECGEIGQIPPRPPGLRAALGAVGVSIMHRLMFWYTPALERTIGGLAGAMEDAIDTLDRALDRMGHTPGPRAWAAETRLPSGSVPATALEVRLNEQARALEQERITTIGLESSLREQIDLFQQLEAEQRRKEEDLGRRLEAADERLQLLRREVLDHAHRLVSLAEEVRQVREAAAQAPPEAGLVEHSGGPGEHRDAHAADDLALHAGLESEVRGTRGEAQARWRVYLPLVPREGTVLDLGCGRGEWLELLRQEGITARGVDWNRLMVAECRERRLEVEQAEALEYLARTPDGSLGAVTVLRLVEHLPLHQLVRLLDEVARVLRLGGTAIFETPNPENVLVASRDFYRDPARVHPIPAATLRFLVESRGLAPVEVLYLNPAGDSERLPENGESAVTRRFNRYFYGPRDYAVVSRKV
jgi:SAM-dependent methyltransferase